MRPTFIKGPVCWAWVKAAVALRGHALAVGLHVWLWAGILKTYESVPLNLRRLGFPYKTASRGLRALEDAGLVSVVRPPGRKPLVTLRAAPTRARARSTRVSG